MGKALLIIDVQNEYFPGGAYPQWNAEVILERIEKVIKKAKAKHIPIILVQHVSGESKEKMPFFQEGTEGVRIHPRVVRAVSKPIIIKKSFADSFYETNLEEILSNLNASELFICGMMTQNCVTHTALSQAADKYTIKIIPDCCTSVDQMIHMMALNALSIRMPFINSEEVLKD